MRKNYKEPKMKPLDLKGEVILAGSNMETEGYHKKKTVVPETEWE